MSKKINRLFEILNILDFWQIFDIVIFPFIFIISYLVKHFCTDIWIIEENPNEACDNGFVFFKYLREHHKNINVYYIISKKSKDYNKVVKYGNVISHRSLKHWIYYLNAKRIIVTQKYANPSPALFYVLHTKNILKTPRIFLQHGITKDNASFLYYERTKFRLLTCGAKREYDYVLNNFHYPKENVVYTGLARYDNLDLSLENHNTILIAPTWRKWIKNQNDFDLFMKNYYDLLDNNSFLELIEKKDLKVYLVLHKNMSKFKISYLNNTKNINILHNHEVDIQELINEADLFITDFSSTFFDIAYRKKPIIYYQFDTEKYREKQLVQGYFYYDLDGFGDIINDSNKVIEKINFYINNNFKIEKKYEKRMNSFFERKDKKNCQRILEEIKKI